MPSFKTFYRAAVMIATGVIVVKGWQLYGPSTERLKSFAVAAIEGAQAAWNKPHRETTQDTGALADPRTSTPPLVAAAPETPVNTTPPESAPGLLLPADSNEAHSADAAAGSAGTGNLVPSSTPDDAPGGIAEVADDLPARFARLTAMGVSDQRLTTWGSSGRLYRFCCRAKLSDSSFHTRHFEAVAEQPAGAVEQVVVQVEAWRKAQAEQTAMR
jgi:hypothetical protein